MTYDAPFLQLSQGFFIYDIIFIISMLNYLFYKKFTVKLYIPKSWLYLICFFICSHLITISLSLILGYPNLEKELLVFIKWIYLFSLMVFFSVIVMEYKQIKESLWYFLIGVIIVSVFGVYQVLHATGGQQLAEFYYRIGEHEGSMLNANTLTIQIAIASPIVFLLLLSAESYFKKWLFFLILIFLFFVTFFVFSKGGWTGFLIGTASSALLNIKKIGRFRLVVLILIFCGLIFYSIENIPFLMKIPSAIEHRLSEGQMTGSFLRVDYFINVFNILLKEPSIVLLTGVGFKNYVYMFHEKYSSYSLLAAGDNPHNLLSYLIFGTGLVGAFLVYMLFLSMFWVLFKYRKILRNTNAPNILYLNMFISWLFVTMWFSLISAYPIFHHTFWIIAGIIGRHIYNIRKEYSYTK